MEKIEKFPLERITLKKYPKEPHALWNMPVRYHRKRYQVFNGVKWITMKIKKLK